MEKQETQKKPMTVFWIASALILVLVVGTADYLTGFEISFSIFYLIPVMLATWYVGRHAGIVLACISAFVWLLEDLKGHAYSHSAIPYWNMLVTRGAGGNIGRTASYPRMGRICRISQPDRFGGL